MIYISILSINKIIDMFSLNIYILEENMLIRFFLSL